jgi:hypothetical protein
MARFLMNVMLASGGFPWTVIRVEDRDDYLHALDSASIETDIKPFAQFIERSVRQSLDSGRHRELTFSAPQERYISSRDVVVYFGQDGNGGCDAPSGERRSTIISTVFTGTSLTCSERIVKRLRRPLAANILTENWSGPRN